MCASAMRRGALLCSPAAMRPPSSEATFRKPRSPEGPGLTDRTPIKMTTTLKTTQTSTHDKNDPFWLFDANLLREHVRAGCWRDAEPPAPWRLARHAAGAAASPGVAVRQHLILTTSHVEPDVTSDINHTRWLL